MITIISKDKHTMRYRFFLAITLLTMFLPSSALSFTIGVVEPPQAKPAMELSDGDSCTTSLSYNDGSTFNTGNTVTISLDEELEVYFYFSDFSYSAGIGGTGNLSSSVLKISLEQLSSSSDDKFVKQNMPVTVDSKRKLTIHGEKSYLSYVLPAGTYCVTYSGIIQGDIATLSLQNSIMSSATITSFSLAMAAHLQEQPVVKPTEPYPSVQPPAGGSTYEISMPCNENYIGQIVYTKPDGQEGMTTFDYYDGLGDKMETVRSNYSPTNVDLAEFFEYDVYGNLARQWLPGACAQGNNGAFVEFPTARSCSVITNADDQPYDDMEYEQLQEGRVTKKWGAGKAWKANKRGKLTEYVTNSSAPTDAKVWNLKCIGNDISAITIKVVGMYEEGSLLGTRVTDEDGNKSITFTDRQGNVVLKRQDNTVSTYYIYDEFGNLQAICPPALSAEISGGGYLPDERVRQYAYLYQYDKNDRLIAKKLPGADFLSMKYDENDHLVSIQDGEQRKRDEKTIILHDVHGRECVYGIVKNNVTFLGCPYVRFSGKNSDLGGYELFMEESGKSKLLDIPFEKVLQINYYDNYDFLELTSMSPSLLPKVQVHRTQGLLTGEMSALLGTNAQDKMTMKALCYDSRGRVVHEVCTNHLAGYDVVDTEYDFLGKPTRKETKHIVPGKKTHSEVYNFEYDTAGRLLQCKHRIDGGRNVSLSRKEYDELGRLKSVARNGNTSFGSTYTYNVRSWPTMIDGSYFQERLYYNTNPHRATPLYGGNLSAITWRADGKYRSYAFEYDRLDRLTSAEYYENGKATHHYDAWYEYDIMGNILSLQRNGFTDSSDFGRVDNLAFSYAGNQLVKVDDKVSSPTRSGSFDFKDGAREDVEYGYDANGNMTMDKNKGIEAIEYNVLNLPSLIKFSNGVNVEYLYSAGGDKLQVKYISSIPLDTLTVDYCGNYIYENGVLRQLLVDGGYITLEQDAMPSYHFYLKDHLGSNRLVVDEEGKVEQRNHYYPYGGLMAESKNGDVQRYMYNGKELDRMHGLDAYDYGARMYDANLCQWNRGDEKGEKFPNISNYAYCDSNPINKLDPDGNEKIDLLENKKSNYGLKLDLYNFVDEKNVINIWSHGSKNGLEYNSISDAKSFEKMLNAKSFVWRNIASKKNTIIVLHSCQTSDFAKKLSESGIFKDVLIVAPDENLQVRFGYDKKKKFHISTGVCSYDGKNIKNIMKSTGSWVGYKNGKVYNTYDGNFKEPRQNSEKPGAKGFDYRTFLQKLIDSF